MQDRPLILIACAPSEVATLERLVPRNAQVLRVSSVDEALARLELGVDAIVCSLQFDESRMLELAREAHARLPDVPILCCNTQTSAVTRSWVHAAAIAAASLGAAAFIDIPEVFPADLGNLLMRILGK